MALALRGGGWERERKKDRGEVRADDGTGLNTAVQGDIWSVPVGKVHLPGPVAFALPLSFPPRPCFVSPYSNKRLALLYPFLSQSERMCLETVAEGAILFLKKKH